MALTLIDSFEHGSVATGAGGMYASVGGTPAIVTTQARTGLRSLEITASGAAENVQYTSLAARVLSISFYIRFQTLPAATVSLLFGVNANGNFAFRYNQTNNVFQVQASTGGVSSDVGPTLATGQWYLVDLELNTTANPATWKAKIDGGTEASVSPAQAAADVTALGLGTNAAQTFTAYYDDFIAATAAAAPVSPAYPIGVHQVEAKIVNSDGTHNITTSGDFDSFTGTAFSNATTTGNTFIDHRPLQLANTANNVIRQELGTTANYMEFGLENLDAGTMTPIDIRAIGVHIESAASNASLAEARLLLSDDTEVLTTGSISVINSTEDPGTTVTVRRRMCIRPSGDWDRTKVDGLKFRIGFGDNAPDVNFIDLMIEVALVQGAQDVTPGLISQTAATFTPTITPGAVTVAVGLISQLAATFSPTVALLSGPQDLTAGLISQLAAVFSPTIVPGTRNIDVPFIGTPASVFSITLSQVGGAAGGALATIIRARRRR